MSERIARALRAGIAPAFVAYAEHVSLIYVLRVQRGLEGST